MIPYAAIPLGLPNFHSLKGLAVLLKHLHFKSEPGNIYLHATMDSR
jgi:hypothetical protein